MIHALFSDRGTRRRLWQTVQGHGQLCLCIASNKYDKEDWNTFQFWLVMMGLDVMSTNQGSIKVYEKKGCVAGLFCCCFPKAPWAALLSWISDVRVHKYEVQNGDTFVPFERDGVSDPHCFCLSGGYIQDDYKAKPTLPYQCGWWAFRVVAS